MYTKWPGSEGGFLTHILDRSRSGDRSPAGWVDSLIVDCGINQTPLNDYL